MMVSLLETVGNCRLSKRSSINYIRSVLGGIGLGIRRSNMKMINRLVVSLAALSLATQFCMAQDAKDCKDSPLVSRFPGSTITKCLDKADELATLPMGTKPSKKVEGEFH